jgi:hypothetical protein
MAFSSVYRLFAAASSLRGSDKSEDFKKQSIVVTSPVTPCQPPCTPSMCNSDIWKTFKKAVDERVKNDEINRDQD